MLRKDDVVDLFSNISNRLILANIPIIGTSMDVIYTEVTQFRNDLFIKEILNDLNFSKIDNEFLYGLEFRNIFIRTWKIVMSEIYEDKIIYYSKLIKDTLESDEIGRRYNFDYIKTISELSVEQMCILKELYIQQKDIVSYSGDNFGNVILTKTDYKNISKILEDNYSITNDEFEFLAKRTEATGLIHEILYLDDEGNMGYVYAINTTLIKLMEKLNIE